jgi:hypothetical protein
VTIQTFVGFTARSEDKSELFGGVGVSYVGPGEGLNLLVGTEINVGKGFLTSDGVAEVDPVPF